MQGLSDMRGELLTTLSTGYLPKRVKDQTENETDDQPNTAMT
jgi:hypothetical protein